MKDIIKLLRCKHYIKNLLIFLPMFFGKEIFNSIKLKNGLWGFFAFCMVSSAIYVINDLKDIEKDRNHSIKKNRPLASGRISPKTGVKYIVICISISALISLYLRNIAAALFLLTYFILNIAYSMKLKNIPIMDVAILASGFVIRVFYGGSVTGIVISRWLYLLIVAGSLYMGLGKRYGELNKQFNSRDVLKWYNVSFLRQNMYVCVALADVFYALWTIEMPDARISWTVPVFIILLMCYSLSVEGESDGDPVEIILHNKMLISIIIIYACCIFYLLYY